MPHADEQRDERERGEGQHAPRGDRQRERDHPPSVPGKTSHVGNAFVPKVCRLIPGDPG
jgi:hypothetical protein